MAKKVLLIVPARSRPDKAAELYAAFREHSVISDLIFGLDDDDPDLHRYTRYADVMYEVNPRARMNGTLNLLANKYAHSYDYLAFMGDDHRPRTPGWDEKLVAAISQLNHGVAYGDDFLQGENLPTAVLLDARIVRVLGYMAPPVLRHLYLDNFWKDLGTALTTLRYVPSVIIEHMHYSNGKAAHDAAYADCNSGEMYNYDGTAYAQYRRDEFEQAVQKLRAHNQD